MLLATLCLYVAKNGRNIQVVFVDTGVEDCYADPFLSGLTASFCFSLNMLGVERSHLGQKRGRFRNVPGDWLVRRRVNVSVVISGLIVGFWRHSLESPVSQAMTRPNAQG